MIWLLSRRRFLASSLATAAVAPMAIRRAAAEDTTKTEAMAEFGEPLYKPGFDHWLYANPDAPKGGRIVLADFGSFDSLNPYVLQGDFPSSIGLIGDGLMIGSDDELSSESGYPLVALSAEYPDDKSWIIFNLNPDARFDDGVKTTAAEVKSGFDTIKQYGRPFLKSFYEDIESCEVLADDRAKFVFKTRDNMKPLLIASGTAPLPRHYWASRDISKPTLEPPLGNSSYRIAKV